MSSKALPWLASATLGVLASLLLGAGVGSAARIPDVRSTAHNLSTTGPGSVKATTESQVCVFCHTPHSSENIPAAPLWNRKLSGQTYVPYTSSSIDANMAEMQAGPGGSSKLCLSCHDGSIAIGNVNVLNRATNVSIEMSGTGPGGVMPQGEGGGTGFTRDLGVNLTNDHPISLTYDSNLAHADGELRVPDGVIVGNRVAGVRPVPKLPLDNGQLQCTSCHDPHIRETDEAKGPQKFMRANRFQEFPPTGGGFSEEGDIICLACHSKAGQSWAMSAHANPQVADVTYRSSAASLREFPDNIPVWKASCLNCHDNHTVQGSRRLLREGTDSMAVPKSGGDPAGEETCYQCHTNITWSALNPNSTVANLQDDFALPRRMPINNAEQGKVEPHDIGTHNPDAPTQRGKDLIESRILLGVGDASNRHAECSDCHNPHRVIKNRLFHANGAIPDAAGTHEHDEASLLPHSNIASGVLRGSWGVEPIYGSASFQSLPIMHELKRGDPGLSANTDRYASHVTREYQICLKCHSDYGYTDNNVYPFGTRPDLGYPGGTPSGTNALTQYTNQAKEFQAPLHHKGAGSSVDSGASAGYQLNNHRSWHPVMDDTGRDHATRGTTIASFRSPWKNHVGSQTMYCSDCHGSNTAPDTVVPNGGEHGNPWGPHGSTNDFILKGEWSQFTGATPAGAYTSNALCFKCHDPASYASAGGNGGSGFATKDLFTDPRCSTTTNNLHACHADVIGNTQCTWCHTAVPHGWKNKGLLVNLNDVGPEAGRAPGTGVNDPFTEGPYYLNARLRVSSFAQSGQWTKASCGSSSGCHTKPLTPLP